MTVVGSAGWHSSAQLFSSAERAAECGRERWLVLPVHPLPLLVRVIECILTFE